MFKNLSYILFISIAFIGCKSSEVVNLPEHTIFVEDPNKTPTRPVYNASNTKAFDLIHTKLDVRFNWMKAHLYGKAEVSLSPHFYSQNELTLDARGMDISKVQLITIGADSLPLNTDLTYAYDSLQLKIILNKDYTKEDTLKLFIEYISKPNELTEGGSAAITSDKGLYFINEKGENKEKPQQIWTQGETQANSAWFPTIDSPNQKSTQEIAITVSEKFKTLSNGVLSYSEINGDGTRTDFWEQNKKHAPYLFMMAVGDFAMIKDTWRGIDVNYYVEHEYKQYAKDIFGLTPEMLEFFSNKLGVTYPWQKYSQVIVRDYVSGAMENTSAVIFGDYVQQTKRELIDGSAGEDVIAHELFHHWFGDLVTCESWSNLPLNESFATYGEVLWREFKYGDDKAAEGLQNDLNSYLSEVSKGNHKEMVRFDFNSREDMFDRHTYQKGGRILHMLRNHIGDDAFFASLKLYLETNQYTDVEMHQLRLACEKVTGQDLNWFFNQWFYAKGHPELNINYSYNDSLKTQSITVEQMQKLDVAPIYYLPVNIDIYVDGKVETHKVIIDKITNAFTFNVSSKPDFVNFDSDKMLLCEKADNHTTIKEWAFLYNNGPRYLDRYEAIKKLAESEDTLAIETMTKALTDKYPYLRRVAIRAIKKAAKANPETVTSVLLTLAKTDPESKVRGDALTALSTYSKTNETVKEVLINATTEKSYYVISNALEGLSLVNYEEAMKFSKSFEGEMNNQIKGAISKVYAQHGGIAQHPFFLKSIPETKGYGKYSLIKNYTNYLKNQDNATLNEALPLLAAVAKNEKTWWIRLAGINALSKLEKIYKNRIQIAEKELKKMKPGANKEVALKNSITSSKALKKEISAILNEIKSTEKNPRLRQMMGLKD
jgi:aminopeptidase N